MAFLDTQPAPINRGESSSHWAQFRVRNPRQQLATLRDICRGDTPVVLGTSGGPTLQATLWAVDPVKNRLHFKLDAETGAMSFMSMDTDLWAAAYVDDAKVQFELADLELAMEKGHSILTTRLPEAMYSLPRRQSMRVRRSGVTPVARFAHPMAPTLNCELTVLDVSASGCALLRMSSDLSLPLDMLLEKVEIELDDHTIIFSDLLVHHVTVHSAKDRSMRVGCEWQGLAPVARERLTEWIGRGRRRRELMSLTLE